MNESSGGAGIGAAGEVLGVPSGADLVLELALAGLLVVCDGFLGTRADRLATAIADYCGGQDDVSLRHFATPGLRASTNADQESGSSVGSP